MIIRNIVAVYFSPTENAKKIATFLALYVQKQLRNRNGMNDCVPIEYVEFTLPECRLHAWEFTHDELVIIGCISITKTASQLQNWNFGYKNCVSLTNTHMSIYKVAFAFTKWRLAFQLTLYEN